jgi:hypothetical protein
VKKRTDFLPDERQGGQSTRQHPQQR